MITLVETPHFLLLNLSELKTRYLFSKDYNYYEGIKVVSDQLRVTLPLSAPRCLQSEASVPSLSWLSPPPPSSASQPAAPAAPSPAPSSSPRQPQQHSSQELSQRINLPIDHLQFLLEVFMLSKGWGRLRSWHFLGLGLLQDDFVVEATATAHPCILLYLSVVLQNHDVVTRRLPPGMRVLRCRATLVTLVTRANLTSPPTLSDISGSLDCRIKHHHQPLSSLYLKSQHYNNS